MTRMRGTNSEVGHAWANATHDEGQSGNGNLWFDGPILYSYRTPIAAVIEDRSKLGDAFNAADGRKVYLVTSETFSKTTSGKHMPAVWRGIGYNTSDTRLTFAVPSVQAPHLRADLAANAHAANLAHLETLARGIVERARSVRMGTNAINAATRWDDPSYRGEARFIEEASEAADRASRYAFAFGLSPHGLLYGEHEFGEAFREARAIFAERLREWSTPEAIAKRHTASAKRSADRDAAAARKAAREAAQNAETIAEWRAGKRFSLPYGIRLSHALVRADGVTRDASGGLTGGTLVTSQGVRVPLLEAVAIFKVCATVRARGEAFDPRGRMTAGNFRVDRIAADGSFRAGCHAFAWAECEALALSLGILESAQ